MMTYIFQPASPRSHFGWGPKNKAQVKAGQRVEMSESDAKRIGPLYPRRPGIEAPDGSHGALILVTSQAPAPSYDERVELMQQADSLEHRLGDALAAKADADKRATRADLRAAQAEAKAIQLEDDVRRLSVENARLRDAAAQAAQGQSSGNRGRKAS